MPRARACVLLLCGIPAAGKTTLCRKLSEGVPRIDSTVKVYHICFDEIHSKVEGRDQPFDPSTWKENRNVAFQVIEDEVSKGTSSDRKLVIVDDNMHYRSMRRAVFQIARTHKADLVHLHLDINPCEALERNCKRSQMVPEHTISKMASVLEPPNGDLCPWEKKTIKLTCNAVPDTEELWHEIDLLWAEPVDDYHAPQNALERKIIGQEANAKSLLHQLDNNSRQELNRAISVMKARGDSTSDITSIVPELNRLRKQMLQDKETFADSEFYKRIRRILGRSL